MTDAQAQLDDKTLATLKARAALAGFELQQFTDGAFLISRWGMSREFAAAAEVEQFLQRAAPGSAGG